METPSINLPPMGFAVLHIDKAKGNDTAMSAHIERTVSPANADASRTHLNRELIQFPEGVHGRSQAIEHRIDTAGIYRKISENQVKALRFLLTGSHDEMMRLEREGRLPEWCEASVKWLQNTYGKENVVAATLHMDERTPHIHATVVPIVQGERRKAGKEAGNGKRKYKVKRDKVRLCSDDVYNKQKLEEYQTDYALAMERFGLERGQRGSDAKHTTTMEYYKELVKENERLYREREQLQEAIGDSRERFNESRQTLARQEERKFRIERENERKQARHDELTEKIKTLEKTAGKLRMKDALFSIFGNPELDKAQKRIEALEKEVQTLRYLTEKEKAEIRKEVILLEDTVKSKDRTIAQQLRELEIYREERSWIERFFAGFYRLMNIRLMLRKMGFYDDTIVRMHRSENPERGTARVYSSMYRREFTQEDSLMRITKDEKMRPILTINGLSVTDWCEQKWQEMVKRNRQGKRL